MGNTLDNHNEKYTRQIIMGNTLDNHNEKYTRQIIMGNIWSMTEDNKRVIRIISPSRIQVPGNLLIPKSAVSPIPIFLDKSEMLH